MLISPDEINRVLSYTGNLITNRGKKYFEQSRVKLLNFKYVNDDNFEAISKVTGTDEYITCISKENGKIKYSCNCPNEADENVPCKHIIAMFFDMYIDFNKYYELSKNSESKSILDYEEELKNIAAIKKEKAVKKEKNNQNNVLKSEKLNFDESFLSYYEKLEFDKFEEDNLTGKLKLVPYIDIYGLKNSNISIYFKIGINSLYILKDVYSFVDDFITKKEIKLGKSVLKVKEEIFDENSKKLFYLLKKNYYKIKYMNLMSNVELPKNSREYVAISYDLLDYIFDIFENQSINVYSKKSNLEKYTTFLNKNPILNLNIESDVDGNINLSLENDEYTIYSSIENSYILLEDTMYRCTKDFTKNVLPVLEELQKDKDYSIKIAKDKASTFCNYLVPSVKKYVNLDVKDDVIEKYKTDKLVTKVYLDLDELNNIIANVKFVYNDMEFNPFSENKEIKCNRDIIQENKAKSMFAKYKFKVNEKKGYLFLDDEDDIYEFLVNGTEIFMNKFEVLVTEKLKNKQIINTTSLDFGVRIKNDLLDISVENMNFSEKELKEIFAKYKEKKKYYRLKNGTYINLDGYGIDTLYTLNETLGISEKDIASSNITLPKYRALYVDNILKDKDGITVNKESSFKNIIKDINNVADAEYEIPKNLNATLREYQKTGYNWLKSLEKYGFGGILADDMGLGKTIQLIAVLLDSKNNEKNSTSIVVCPSSLYINWEKELKKFAPSINMLVISGSSDERRKLIKKASKYDVIITSYDMLKRDIELYESYNFKYIIADEAQYIKNNNTKNARALKRLNGKTRFALTGTPIENSLSELWSIFDYIMPGYLFSYKKFKDNYESKIIKDESKKTLEKLQRIVAPFVLRRVKKEVLKELPEKTESIMYSKMDEEQEKVYDSYLYNAKKELEDEISKNGIKKSRIKILSTITRLRQICAHPSLFLSDYNYGSAKLEQCMQIIEDAVSAGHKILLFSGFTSMFDIISKRLEKNEIKYSILTGKTKASNRVDMVEEFNISDDTKVFLISLKAGGTGLNLIGADMVIHYDPWWNLSAQNQATDRAYRIGQKSNVQVFKLITQNSIEEKILALQEKKKDIIDNVITEKETFLSKLSEEDIMELFE